MTTCLGKEMFIRFTARAFHKLLSIYVFSYFPFGFEGRMWDLIVSVPDHCISFYFTLLRTLQTGKKLLSSVKYSFLMFETSVNYQLFARKNQN